MSTLFDVSFFSPYQLYFLVNLFLYTTGAYNMHSYIGITESAVVLFPSGNNRRKGGSTKRANVNGDLWINLESNEKAKV